MTSYRCVTPAGRGDTGTFAGYAGSAEVWAPSISAGLLADLFGGARAEWL
jgi:hypothetical protein